MKKINYFGKEYKVSDNREWIATNWRGTVMAFSYEPVPTDCGWAGGAFDVLDRLPVSNACWKNSLRQVKDIIVKENKLKVGDKVELLGNYCGFKKGQIVEVYGLRSDGIHLFKGNNFIFKFCNGEQGAFLSECEYKKLGNSLDSLHENLESMNERKPHPHADLMLKYAMIAQYDDKPWENFECDLGDGYAWCDMMTTGFHRDYNYRLKPQEPKIQIGQVWTSKEGVDVMIDTPSDAKTIYFSFNVFGCHYKNFAPIGEFTRNFKRKE